MLRLQLTSRALRAAVPELSGASAWETLAPQGLIGRCGILHHQRFPQTHSFQSPWLMPKNAEAGYTSACQTCTGKCPTYLSKSPQSFSAIQKKQRGMRRRKRSLAPQLTTSCC